MLNILVTITRFNINQLTIYYYYLINLNNHVFKNITMEQISFRYLNEFNLKSKLSL